MSDVRFSHDELGRVFRTDAALFVPGGQSFLRTPALSDHDGDGFVTARVDYDALSRATHVVEDDLEVTRTIYDGASRVIEVRDALGNRRLVQHDRNGNAVAATSVEVSAEGLVPPQGFTTRYVYDQLDRLIRATDNAGQTSRFAYDSRDNLVFRSDPEGALTADPLGVFPGTINAHGNTVTYHFDGLDRMIRQVVDLRVGGTGAGGLDLSNPRNPDGQISLGYVFDGNSRLSAIVDDNGNRTTFGYDALNRRVRQTNADGKSYLFQFDRDDNVRQVTDPNGSVITKTYDALNRLVELSVARGSGVVGTTHETYSYDGLSRLTRSTDDNGHAATALQVAEATFDSLGRVLEERQNGRAVSSQYTGDGKRTQVMYPGGRTITRAFDAIDRIKQLKDGPTVLAHTDWIGPGLRELRRINANGTRLTFLNDAGNADIGYDQVQRIVRLRVTGAGGAAIVDRIYGYNRASQRTLERRHDDFGLTDRYTYDSAYRVVASSYDQDGLPGAVKRDLNAVSYRYDGVGNRRDVTKDVVGVGVLAEAYTVNAVNEYVSVAGVTRRHDDNGNLTDDGRRLLHYDYKNRLVAVSDRATGAPVAAYEYLADGRRAKKKLFGPTGQVVKATAFFYDGAQEVEEQDATSGATEATYVWSPVYVDELVTYTNSLGTFFTHQDARCNVVAITDAAGAVVERVRFDDFGRAEVRGPGGEVRAASAVGCAYGFQGRRLDAETGLLYFRARYYDPETGRFLQRDPVWDAGNVGGQYTFCGNGPLSRRDPQGLQQYTSGAQEDLWERYRAANQAVEAETSRFFGPREDKLAHLERMRDSIAGQLRTQIWLDQYHGERGGYNVAERRPYGQEERSGVDWGRIAGEAFVPGYGLDLDSPGLDPSARASKIVNASQSFVQDVAVGAVVVVATGPLLRAVNAARAGHAGLTITAEAGVGAEAGLTRYTAQGMSQGVDVMFESTLKKGGVLYVDWVERGLVQGLRETLANILANGGQVSRIEGYVTDQLAKNFDPCRLARGLERELGGTWKVMVEQRGNKKWVSVVPN